MPRGDRVDMGINRDEGGLRVRRRSAGSRPFLLTYLIHAHETHAVRNFLAYALESHESLAYFWKRCGPHCVQSIQYGAIRTKSSEGCFQEASAIAKAQLAQYWLQAHLRQGGRRGEESIHNLISLPTRMIQSEERLGKALAQAV